MTSTSPPGPSGIVGGPTGLAPQPPAQAPTPPTVAGGAAPPASTTLTDLASQTAAQVKSGASQFQITLTPEGLGQVSVTVNVGAEGRVSAAFAFEKPETAEALGGRAAELQTSLEQAGFSLAAAGLSFSVAPAQGHAAAQGGGAQDGFTQANGQGGNGQGGNGQGANGQGANGQGFNGQNGSGQGGGAAFAQTPGGGGGQGDGQARSWTYDQAAGRAFASASDAAAAVDRSPRSAYASRAASGLDIRI